MRKPASSRCSNLLLTSVLVVFFLSSVMAEDWPAFRGPTGQGRTTETNLPLTFSETENVTWKTMIPGKGWSSPVIMGNEVWMSTAVVTEPLVENTALGKKKKPRDFLAESVSLRAICVDKVSGKITRDVELISVAEPESIHTLNSYASPTPVLTENRVYFHFGTYGTVCINRSDAKEVWQRQLPLQHAVGPGSSPIVWRDLLILVCDGMETQYVTALNRDTGKEVWKTHRPKMAGDDGDFHKAFSTPLAIEWDGQPQLLIPGAQWFVSYEPTSGRELWQINHGRGFSNVAAPVFADGIGYLITGFTKPKLWAIPVQERGELTEDRNVLWEQPKQVPKKSSPQLVGSEIYMVSDSGVLSCVDVNSGDLNWSARMGGNYSASPLHSEDRLYFSSQNGQVIVVKPNAKKFEKLAENKLDGQIMASPAANDSALFVRTDQALYRIEEK